MAKLLWEEREVGSELLVKADRYTYIKAEDIVELADITTIQGLSDSTRGQISDDAGYSNLAEYDNYLERSEWQLKDRIDYYDNYDTKIVNITAMNGAWFSPEVVESVRSEDINNEAIKSIDENDTTFFRDSINQVHKVVYRLRTYPKKITKIRFWYSAGESARERLNDISVSASRELDKINKSKKILETGINILWPTPGGVWVEHVLAKAATQARYIKLTIGDTDNANNQCQIREFEVWVTTLDSNEMF